MIEQFASRAAAYLENGEDRRRIQKYVDVYLAMMQQLEAGDISRSPEFHRLYNVFYKLRFSGSNGHTSGEIYSAYYRLLEEHRQDRVKPSIEQVLLELWELTGKTHLSFSSKLIGTLYPQSAPIWDANVRALLDIPYAFRPGSDRLALAAAAYHALEKRYQAFAPVGGPLTGEAAAVVEVFNQAFPCGREIPVWKKIDFLLWRMGSRKSRDRV